MLTSTKIFYKSPRGKSLKKRLKKELNKKIPEIIYMLNKTIQEDNYCYGIFYNSLDNRIYNQLGYHIKIYFDYENLSFTYSLYRLKDNSLLKTLIIRINKK